MSYTAWRLPGTMNIEEGGLCNSYYSENIYPSYNMKCFKVVLHMFDSEWFDDKEIHRGHIQAEIYSLHICRV